MEAERPRRPVPLLFLIRNGASAEALRHLRAQPMDFFFPWR